MLISTDEAPEHVEGYSYDHDAWRAAMDAGVPYYWIVRPHYDHDGRYQIRKTEGPLGHALGKDLDLDRAKRVVDELREFHARRLKRSR